MSISFTGLASGIDTMALVDSLVGVAGIPKLQLEAKAADQRKEITALQDLNSKIAALATQAKGLTGAGSLSLFTTTASSDAATATAGTGATAGSIDIAVDSIATAQTSVTAKIAEAPTASFTITSGGKATPVDAVSNSLDDVVKAINSVDAGVSAVKVAAGTDANGNQLYRLQLTAKETGTAGSFTVEYQDANGTTGDLLAGGFQVTPPKDAVVRLWPGALPENQQTITSSSNTFTGLLPGVDVTVAKASADPVTITVADDTDARAATVKGLLDAVTAIFGSIEIKTRVTTGADGKTTAGVLQGESVVRDAKTALLRSVTDPVDGRSPSEIGIEITKTGSVTFDEKKFAAALAADPDRVQSVFTAIAGRVEQAADGVSDRYDGRLTSSIQSRESAVKRLDKDIAAWDSRLELQRRRLTAQFTNMEVQLSAMQSQMSWLTSQIASMPTASSASSN